MPLRRGSATIQLFHHMAAEQNMKEVFCDLGFQAEYTIVGVELPGV